MLNVSSFLGIDEIVLLGDYADFYSVSRFCKHPKVDTLLQDEVLNVREGLDELDRLFPRAKKVYLEGNHEARLESYLVEKAPGLFGVTECRTLFELNTRPLWTYIPFDRNQKYRVLETELYAFHRPKGPNPRAHIQRTHVSSVYGDIHKIEQARAVGVDGRHLTAVCPGWLGDVGSRVFDYMPSVPQWQLGFSIVTKDDASLEFYIETFEIKNNQTVVHGKRFKA
jgi:hypothetical protein